MGRRQRAVPPFVRVLARLSPRGHTNDDVRTVSLARWSRSTSSAGPQRAGAPRPRRTSRAYRGRHRLGPRPGVERPPWRWLRQRPAPRLVAHVVRGLSRREIHRSLAYPPRRAVLRSYLHQSESLGVTYYSLSVTITGVAFRRHRSRGPPSPVPLRPIRTLSTVLPRRGGDVG